MASKAVGLGAVCFFFAPFAFSQDNAASATPVSASTRVVAVSPHRVDNANTYHRVYAVVPLIGSGRSKNDPRRPMFAPLPSAVSKDHAGIIAYQMHISDDGNFALCEFVGATPQDLKVITTSTAANVLFFERGKASNADIEAAFKKYKKNFTMDMFTTRAH